VLKCPVPDLSQLSQKAGIRSDKLTVVRQSQCEIDAVVRRMVRFNRQSRRSLQQ